MIDEPHNRITMEKGCRVYDQTRARLASNPALGKTTIRAIARLLEDMHMLQSYSLVAANAQRGESSSLPPVIELASLICTGANSAFWVANAAESRSGQWKGSPGAAER